MTPNRIVFTLLLSDGFCSNIRWTYRRYTVTKTVSAGRSIAITLEAKKTLMQHTKKMDFF